MSLVPRERKQKLGIDKVCVCVDLCKIVLGEGSVIPHF
jgi:hypothetical protein